MENEQLTPTLFLKVCNIQIFKGMSKDYKGYRDIGIYLDDTYSFYTLWKTVLLRKESLSIINAIEDMEKRKHKCCIS